MNRLASLTRVFVCLLLASTGHLAFIDTTCAEERVSLSKVSNTEKWKFQVDVKSGTLGAVWLGDSELTLLPETAKTPIANSTPPRIQIAIPKELQKTGQAQELTVTFDLAAADGKPASRVMKKVQFNPQGVFTMKAGPRAFDPGIQKTTNEFKENSTAPRSVKDSAEMLRKWIVDRATHRKVPGVAYYDHQPKKTTEALAQLFSGLAKTANEYATTVDATQKDFRILELRKSMREGLDRIYDSRPGVKEDWQPFLKEIEAEVGDSHADDSTVAAPGDQKFDLTDFEQIALVFNAVAGAIGDLHTTHDNVEKYFLGGGSLGGSGASGGSGNYTTQPAGSTGDRCRSRRCRSCWSLLLGP